MYELLVLELAQLSTALRNRIEKNLSEIGLFPGQYNVLRLLWEIDGQSQAELSKNLKVTPPTVFNIVTRMADSGLVDIRKCDNDARIMRVFLSEKGKLIQPAAERQWQILEEKIFSDWAETEKMMFSLLLKKLKNLSDNPL